MSPPWLGARSPSFSASQPALSPFATKQMSWLSGLSATSRPRSAASWRTAGFAHEEDSNHFLDLDWQGFGPYPFNALPRDYTAAVAKFGRNRMREMGTLPWAVEERYGALRRAFALYARPTEWRRVRATGMRQHHDWRRAAADYIAVYGQALQAA